MADSKKDILQFHEYRDLLNEAKQAGEIESPDMIYDELIGTIRKYHPSDDISQVEKAAQA